MMAAGREFVMEVIDLYKELPCLWRKGDPHYHNKNKRNGAWDELVQLFKEEDPAATRGIVLKKINSMRGAFRKERNKVRSSMRAGASAGEIHVPRLWYYNLLLFLEDQVPRESRSTQSIIDDMPFSDDENSVEEALLEDPLASSSRQTTPSPPQPNFKTSGSNEDRALEKLTDQPALNTAKHKQEHDAADQVLEKIMRRIDQPTPNAAKQKQQHDAFGEHVAEKLRSLPPRTMSICQKLINDAIFLAEVNALNLSSRIVSDES